MPFGPAIILTKRLQYERPLEGLVLLNLAGDGEHETVDVTHEERLPSRQSFSKPFHRGRSDLAPDPSRTAGEQHLCATLRLQQPL